MFRKQDAILLLVSFSSMALGVFLPQLADPLTYAPMILVMFLLFLSFLNIDLKQILAPALSAPGGTVLLLLGKTIILPTAAFFVFHFCWPKYELAVLLMAGASTAVLAPFFSSLLKANVVLTAAIVILSSMLMPFTLPGLVAILSGKTLTVSFLPMMIMLAIMVFFPAFGGQACTRWLPAVTGWLIRHNFPLALMAIGVTNVGVFSRYSGYFLDNPSLALEALIAGSVLVVANLLAGYLPLKSMKPSFRSTAMVCIAFPNYILILVFSSQFFGPTEATFAATYSIPFFLQLLPLRSLLSSSLPADK